MPTSAAVFRTAKRRRPLTAAMLLMVLFTLVIPSKALTESPYWFDPATGLAIGGFDPVGYFTDGSAIAGKAEHERIWSGLAWRFMSEGNREAFDSHPEIYAPQFGGHDPVALARGRVVLGNPRIWTIRGGRLYFFHSLEARSVWDETVDADLIAKADARWRRQQHR